MEIRIKETNKLESLIVRENGIEWTNDLLGNADATTYNEETEEYEMSQEDFDWWKEYIDNLEADAEAVKELAEELEIDEQIILDRIQLAMQHENDMNDEHAIKQNVLSDIMEEYNISKNKFWNLLSDDNKNKAEIICEGYAGSDGIIGRIFELYTESDMELEANEYVAVYFDSLDVPERVSYIKEPSIG